MQSHGQLQTLMAPEKGCPITWLSHVAGVRCESEPMARRSRAGRARGEGRAQDRRDEGQERRRTERRTEREGRSGARLAGEVGVDHAVQWTGVELAHRILVAAGDRIEHGSAGGAGAVGGGDVAIVGASRRIPVHGHRG